MVSVTFSKQVLFKSEHLGKWASHWTILNSSCEDYFIKKFKDMESENPVIWKCSLYLRSCSAHSATVWIAFKDRLMLVKMLRR